MSEPKRVTQLSSHTAALKAAIANLEQFSSKNESAAIPHIADLSVHDGQLVASEQTVLQKTIEMARCFVASLFSSKARQRHQQKKAQVQGIVLKAIDVIKRNHLLIEKMQKGTPEEQKLAASTIAAIQRYNSVLEQTKISTDWPQTIARFLYKHSGLSVDDNVKSNRIDLPRAHSIQWEISANVPEQKISHAFQNRVSKPQSKEHTPPFSAVMLTKVMSDPLSKQETDLLRIKASTLLKQHNIKLHSMAETLQAIKESPIHTSLDDESSIATLSLLLTLIPGLTIEVQGAFKRDKNLPNYSTPISDRFRLYTHSLHQGFPHPLQYTGWALGNAAVPSYPHRLDQMPLFAPMYANKQESAKALLPEGELFEKAREQWKLRSQTFSAHAPELLKLHRKLNIAVLHAAPPACVPPDTEEVIHQFFDVLSRHPSPIDYLARTHQAINEHFIERPHGLLQDLWINRKDEDSDTLLAKAKALLAEDNELIQRMFEEGCQLALDESEQHALAYACRMGCVIQTSMQSILMQHFSETFGWPPRMLSDFEQKLQTAVYKQLMTFLDDIENWSENIPSNPKSLFQRIKECLESDIALFRAESCDAFDNPALSITHEMEVYFNTRYYSSH